MVAKNKDTPVPETADDLAAVIKRAEDGDASALPVLRTLLKDNSNLVEKLGGDLAATARDALIGAMASDKVVIQEAIKAKIKALRRELAGPHPTPLEQLLVDRVVVCWLNVYHADLVESQNKSLPLAEFCQKRQDRAHRRYLSAIKSLAMIRKLALPQLQVNVARNQLNMSSNVDRQGD